MHPANRAFWKEISAKYPRYFNDPSRIIEFGSFDVNGSIREYCHCQDYTGLDWRPNPAVDVISLAHEAPFPAASFDTVLSASMLEHDPFWGRSLAKMTEVLKPDGIMVLTWGVAKNPAHEEASAPDCKFHALKAEPVLMCMEYLGMYVHEFMYEKKFYAGMYGQEWADKNPGNGLGEAGLVAFKSPAYATGERSIDRLIMEDKIDGVRDYSSFNLPMQGRQEWYAYMDFVRAYFKRHEIDHPIVVEVGVWANWQKPFYKYYLDAQHIGVDMSDKNSVPDILGDSHAPETLAKLKAMLGGKTIDLLFIDAAHDYESVRRDYEIYAPLTKGIIALHDIAGLPGPKQFWNEIIGAVPGIKNFMSIDERNKPRTGIGIIVDP